MINMGKSIRQKWVNMEESLNGTVQPLGLNNQFTAKLQGIQISEV